jgi:type IV fimbrial biogenesis protein FimT
MTTTGFTGRRQKIAGHGFTLIELMLALVIFSLLLAAVLPSYRDWIAAQQLANHAQFIVDTLHVARSEAIKHGYRVDVCKTSDKLRCTDKGGWDQGWLMFVDEDRSGQIEHDTVVLHSEGAALNGVTVHGNHPVQDYVSYTGLGHARLLSGALQMGTFVLCKSGQDALNVVLSNGGRARIDKTKNRCP